MTTSRSHPDPKAKDPVSDRLEHIRHKHGLTRRAFWLRLGEETDEGRKVTWVGADGVREQASYSSVRYYHYDRTPPLSYLLRVSEVFNVKLTWLASGVGPKHRTEEHIAVELAAVERERELEARERRASLTKHELDVQELDDAEREANQIRRAQGDEDLDSFVDETLEAAVVRNDGVVDHPMLASPAVRAAFGLAWERLADTCRDDELSPKQLNAVGRALLELLEHPLHTWGFDHEPRARSRRFEDYGIAMCHALMLGMAEPGQGDPIVDLDSRADQRESGHDG